MTPDVNVLVAASRSDHPHHAVARNWLVWALAACRQGATFRILPMVAASFLRLVTHPKIFVHPTPMDEAVQFLDALLTSPGVEMPDVGTEWPAFRRLCLDKRLTANDVPDAWIAASVMRLGEHLVSFDADFSKLLKKANFTRLKR